MQPRRPNRDEDEGPPSQRPTAPPPGDARRTSGIRWRGAPPTDRPEPEPEPEPEPRSADLAVVPLLVSRRPLEREPAARVTSMLLACMNGVLSAADLAEVTGIPPGAMVDALADLEQRGVIVLLRR